MHIADSKGLDQNNAIIVAGKYEPISRTTSSVDISSYSSDFHVSIEAFDEDRGRQGNRVNVYQIQLIE